MQLLAAHYVELARINGVGGADPGVSLRRHHLLAMESPLGLLRRPRAGSWSSVQLTPLGLALALEPDTPRVLERALDEVVFCRAPSYPPSRVEQYNEFAVRPYRAILSILESCGGVIDRDEYDLLVSRIRTADEISGTVRQILQFRTLAGEDRAALLVEVQSRIPGAKSYQNWRDMSLHTFSVFGLGVSATRVHDRLSLTRLLTETLPVARQALADDGGGPRRRVVQRVLQIPTPPATDELSTPPEAPAVNPGTDGEIFVGKLLDAAGWRVVYYTNRRGFGFDLWASRGQSAILVEVKSSLGTLGTVAMTDLEYQAAQDHGPNFFLALVEDLGGDSPKVVLVQDPAAQLRIDERISSAYHVPRSEWTARGVAFELVER